MRRGMPSESLADEAFEVFFTARNRVELVRRRAAGAASSALGVIGCSLSATATRICSAAASPIFSTAT